MVSSFVGSVPIGVIIDAILFGTAVLTMAAARFLPEHHLSPETKGIVSVSVAVVGTLSALVVGLLISNSSASFTAKSQEVTQISADVINLWLQPQALELIGTMMAARSQLGQEESASGIPLPVLLLVMFWFIIIFASFGLFAPRNMTAIAMIFLCAVGIGTAIRMTTELQTPFGGLIRISSRPLTQALDVISR